MPFFSKPRYAALCALCLFSFHTILAQREEFEAGYIVTSTGDSLNVLIATQDGSLDPKICTYKATSGGELKNSSAKEIKAYGIGTIKRYVSRSIKIGEGTEQVFMSNIVSGKVSLLNFEERFFVDTGNEIKELVTTVTKVTRDGKVYSQELPVYKSVLQSAMNECPSIHENLARTALQKDDLTKLFVDYHKCIGRPAMVYKSNAGKVKVSVGVALSGQSTAFKLESNGNPAYLYLDDNDAMTDFTFAPNLIVEFYGAQGRARLRVRTGLSYYTGNYSQYDKGVPGAYDHELTIKMARAEVPLMLKYYLFKRAALYISAGIGLNFSMKWEQKSVTIIPPMSILSENSDLSYNSFYTNPMAGVGYDFPIGKRRIFAEAIFSQSQSVLADTKNPTSKLNALTFSAGFVF